MNHKNVRESAANFPPASGEANRRQAVFALEEIFLKMEPSAAADGGPEGRKGLFAAGDGYHGEFPDSDLRFQDLCNGLPNHDGFGKLPSLAQSISQKQLCTSVTMDSQSSICAGSPTSILKPNDGDKQANAISGSSGEQSDDDDVEIEAGSCEQSTDALDLKRIRRKVSNRESARRSRKRRQAQLAELEWQVDTLNGENHSLYEELTRATQQLRDAATNNRVLKSDVEALRAKVKLAEELVAQGSLSCNLNHLIQTQNINPCQLLNTPNLPPMANVSPSFTIQGDDNVNNIHNNNDSNALLGAAFNPQNSSIINGNLDAFQWYSNEL